MDKIILGLLLLQRLTVYEIRAFLQMNMQGMCSDSLGSIQAALKKLLANGMVNFEEGVENGVNKKRYHITEAGRLYFKEWVQRPMCPGKRKDMEMSKFFFMGMAPKAKRVELLESYIKELRGQQAYYDGIAAAIPASRVQAELEQVSEKMTSEQIHGILSTSEQESLQESLEDYVTFTLFTLEYARELLAFDIAWFEKLQMRLEASQ